MTTTKILQQTFQDIPLTAPNKSDEQTWSLLIRAVNDHHKVHRIGRPDSSNTLAQVLLSLYNLGGMQIMSLSQVAQMLHQHSLDFPQPTQGK